MPIYPLGPGSSQYAPFDYFYYFSTFADLDNVQLTSCHTNSAFKGCGEQGQWEDVLVVDRCGGSAGLLFSGSWLGRHCLIHTEYMSGDIVGISG